MSNHVGAGPAGEAQDFLNRVLRIQLDRIARAESGLRDRASSACAKPRSPLAARENGEARVQQPARALAEHHDRFAALSCARCCAWRTVASVSTIVASYEGDSAAADTGSAYRARDVLTERAFDLAAEQARVAAQVLEPARARVAVSAGDHGIDENRLAGHEARAFGRDRTTVPSTRDEHDRILHRLVAAGVHSRSV